MPNTIRNSIVTIANYTEVRNEHIKTSENTPLRIGVEQYSPIHPDGVVDRNNPDKVNPTIGYGYNLVDKTLAQNTALFTLAFGGTLTPTMIDALQLLEIWRSKTDFTINSEPVRPRTALLSSYEIFRNFCRNYCRNFFRAAKFLRFVLAARLIPITTVFDSCSSARQTQDFSSKDGQRIHGRGSDCQAKGIER